MAVTLVRSNSALKQNYNTSFVANLGAAPAVDDVVVIEWGGRVVPTPPAGGWQLAISGGAASGGLIYQWWKVVVGGEAGDSNGQYTFTTAGDYGHWTARQLHSDVACTWQVDIAYLVTNLASVSLKDLFPGTTNHADEYVIVSGMFRSPNVSALSFTLPDTTTVTIRFSLTAGADNQFFSADKILAATKDLGTSAGTHLRAAWTTNNSHSTFAVVTYAAVSAGGQSGSYGPAIEDDLAGAFTTTGGYWIAGPDGDYTITAEADPDNVIPEVDGTNNALSKTLTIGGGPQLDLPDLMVLNVTLNGLDADGNAVTGTELTPVAHIYNMGIGPTPAGVAIRVTFYVDNPTPGTHAPGAVIGWSDTHTASLAPNTQLDLPMTGSSLGKSTFTCPSVLGLHHVQAWVDGVGLIAESDETNNWGPDNEFTVVDPIIIPPVGGTRPAADDPFAANSVWKTSLGDGVTADGAQGNGYVAGNFGNISAWGTHVWYGNPPETNTVDSPTSAGEGHVTAVGKCQTGGHLNDRRYARDYYQYWNKSQTWWADIDLHGSGVNLPGTALAKAAGWWGGSTVAGFANCAGLLRHYDLRNGVIRHALACVLGPGQLKLGFVAPAIAQDSDATSSDPLKKYVGSYPIGSLLFIPWGVAEPGGLSVIGKMCFQALRTYGAYVYDRGPNPIYKVEPNCTLFTASDGQTFMQFVNSGQMRTITNLCRRASNNSAAQWGGPGARRGPAALAFAEA